MHILISGASGFIGNFLVNSLLEKHDITVLGRDLKKLNRLFPKKIQKIGFDNLKNHDAKQYDLIINLSGSNIAAKRWTHRVKKELISSRTSTNQILLDWLIQENAKPRFFCANAIGIYGAEDISMHPVDESSPLVRGHDFSQTICLAWEKSLEKAINASIPLTILRFGVVLKKGGGMLKKLELPFRLGLGSIVGSGNQSLSFIHYQDLSRAIHFLIEHPEIIGPVNITSPLASTQKEFAQAFAKRLKRPLVLKTPAWFIKLLFGEMGECLLLKGQNVAPKRLSEMGFHFIYPSIEMSLAQEYPDIHHEFE